MDHRVTGRDAAVKGSPQPTKVTAATTLNPGQTHVVAIIPLATADDYTITLPPVSECGDDIFLIEGIRADGVYVDGNVTVDSQNEGLVADGITTDTMTTSGDYVLVQAVKGRFWRQIAELTRP